MSLLDALREAVGASNVLVDDDLKSSYETDWTGRFSGSACAVVRPADTAEVVAVIRACAAAGTPVVVQGGNTGLVGGGIPAGGEVLLSLTRLTDLGEIDPAAAQVTVGAGVNLSALQRHARSLGLDFGVDLAARDSATVGGLVATNAGGIRVLRYGSMRAQVVGAEAVLADGSVVSRLGGLAKDNTGYDLVSLLCGSEGTLGVLTRLRLRLVPQLRARAVALVALPDTATAVALLPALRGTLPDLVAAELFLPAGLALVRSYAGLPAPFAAEHPVYLVLECAGASDPTEQLVEAVAALPSLLDATVATDAAGQRALWAYREQHTEAIAAVGVPVKLDVSVPVGSLPELVDRLPDVVGTAAPGARLVVFGHVNEGNLHVNVLDAGDGAEKVTDAVLHLVADLAGSISSEHGVGRAKVPWLSLSRSATEIAAMRAVKNALDPAGLLNPGVLLP
ncbi:MAG: linked oxidase domain protein [Frankiales bacterium]|nr:linked oxidase domain protein [Frankiales bacterium]